MLAELPSHESTKARSSPDGAHVYLTDTLESPFASPPGQMTLLHRPLSEEHKRAQKVKAETRVLVCIGNPPYDRQVIEPGDLVTDRKGGWVRFGDHGQRPILEDFLDPARASGAGVHAKNLYNDHVYFWRWALWKVFETTEGPGVVSFITVADRRGTRRPVRAEPTGRAAHARSGLTGGSSQGRSATERQCRARRGPRSLPRAEPRRGPLPLHSQ